MDGSPTQTRTAAASVFARRASFARYGRNVGVVVGWVGAMLGLVGVHLGLAGLMILVGGGLTQGVGRLLAIGGLSTCYLAWFFTVGPGRAPAKRPQQRTSMPATRFAADDRPLHVAPERLRCSGCGNGPSPLNRLVPAKSATLCEQCISEALTRLSPEWIGGLVAEDGQRTTDNGQRS